MHVIALLTWVLFASRELSGGKAAKYKPKPQ
jgi:hypothetical protein